jgi:hypothetical protein
MALTLKQVNDVCLVHQGYDSCRYLTFDPANNIYLCAKLHPKLKTIKDDAVTYNEREAVRAGISVQDYFNIYGIGHGNNCTGYRYLTQIQQGYDIQKNP